MQQYKAKERAEDAFSLEYVKKMLDKGYVDLERLLEEYEKQIILETIKRDIKLTSVASHLKMSPQKLNYRIAKLNIKPYCQKDKPYK